MLAAVKKAWRVAGQARMLAARALLQAARTLAKQAVHLLLAVGVVKAFCQTMTRRVIFSQKEAGWALQAGLGIEG